MAHGRECAFDWVRCAQMLPMLCREVVEGEQSIAVFGQAFDRLLVFNVVDFDERVECDESILLGPGHPDLLQCALGLCLLALRQLVQNICGLVHPTALAARLWPNLLERLPEPECTVGNRELGSDRKPPSSQIEEHLLPGLRALADAVGQTDELLAPPVAADSVHCASAPSRAALSH